MTLGMSTYVANSVLNAMCNATPWSIAQVYVKLHVGDPGSVGTANPAVETLRKAASFALAASGVVANDVAVTWSVIAGSEDASHFSLWDTVGPAGGNFLGSGLNTAGPYGAGDTYDVAIGALTIALAVAA